jgi:uncharacterized membrane protein YdjX (TVP38/TMEM64 family)
LKGLNDYPLRIQRIVGVASFGLVVLVAATMPNSFIKFSIEFFLGAIVLGVIEAERRASQR